MAHPVRTLALLAALALGAAWPGPAAAAPRPPRQEPALPAAQLKRLRALKIPVLVPTTLPAGLRFSALVLGKPEPGYAPYSLLFKSDRQPGVELTILAASGELQPVPGECWLEAGSRELGRVRLLARVKGEGQLRVPKCDVNADKSKPAPTIVMEWFKKGAFAHGFVARKLSPEAVEAIVAGLRWL